MSKSFDEHTGSGLKAEPRQPVPLSPSLPQHFFCRLGGSPCNHRRGPDFFTPPSHVVVFRSRRFAAHRTRAKPGGSATAGARHRSASVLVPVRCHFFGLTTDLGVPSALTHIHLAAHTAPPPTSAQHQPAAYAERADSGTTGGSGHDEG